MKTPSSVTGAALALSLLFAGVVYADVRLNPNQPKAPASPTDGAVLAALEKRVAQLETQIKALEAKTKLISSDGATNFTVNAPHQLTLAGGTTAVSGTTTLTLKSAAAGSFLTSGNLVFKASSVAIDGSVIKLNGGGKQAARQGDMVINNGSGAVIGAGSLTVLIGP